MLESEDVYVCIFNLHTGMIVYRLLLISSIQYDSDIHDRSYQTANMSRIFR